MYMNKLNKEDLSCNGPFFSINICSPVMLNLCSSSFLCSVIYQNYLQFLFRIRPTEMIWRFSLLNPYFFCSFYNLIIRVRVYDLRFEYNNCNPRNFLWLFDNYPDLNIYSTCNNNSNSHLVFMHFSFQKWFQIYTNKRLFKKDFHLTTKNTVIVVEMMRNPSYIRRLNIRNIFDMKTWIKQCRNKWNFKP